MGVRRWLGELRDGQSVGMHTGLPVKIAVMALELAAVFLVTKFSYDLFESRLLRLKKHFKVQTAVQYASASR
jgi:hypothetical protein